MARSTTGSSITVKACKLFFCPHFLFFFAVPRMSLVTRKAQRLLEDLNIDVAQVRAHLGTKTICKWRTCSGICTT